MEQFISDGQTLPKANQYFFIQKMCCPYFIKEILGSAAAVCTISQQGHISSLICYIGIDELKTGANGMATKCRNNYPTNELEKAMIEFLHDLDACATLDELKMLHALKTME